jgi:ankyrin repeat protein
LILAAKNGHLDVFNFLYDNQQSIPCPSWLFENAIRGGNIGIVNRLLDLNFKIDFKDEFGDDETAVDTAAKSGHLEILLRILEKCPEKSTVGVKYVDRAFEIASKNLYKRRYTTVRRNYDSDSDSDDEEEENIINDYMKIVKKMIEIGANVNSNYVYTAALDGAVMSYDRVKKDYVFELINLLIDNGATVTNELITKVKNTEIKDLLKRAQRRGIKPAKA